MNDSVNNGFLNTPQTTEEIKGANVDKLKELNSQIFLEKYNEQWPVEYQKQKILILQALSHLKISIEHVGPTSVPGLSAKPIIDIVLEVPDSSNEESYVPQLESKKFKLKIREPNWWEHRMLKNKTNSINLHIFTCDCPEVLKMIKFRDHLRSNISSLKLYQSKKQQLASRTWKYTQNYADAKTEVIKKIFRKIN